MNWPEDFIKTVGIEPYCYDKNGVIYCGDFKNIVKHISDKSIDLIVTDPPYGLNYNNGDLAHKWEKVFGGRIENMAPRPIENDGEEEANELFRALLNEANRILKSGACCCCCCCGGGGPNPLFAQWTFKIHESNALGGM